MRVRISLILAYALATAASAFCQTTHYLDCGSGNDAGDSLTPQTAWRTVARASSLTYQPGDSLLLLRGAHCDGMLWPKGSGTEQAPIHLGAYGEGALPLIAGGSESAGLRLSDQQYWEIEELEVAGGSPYGIHIGGSAAVMRHFRITNVVVHDVTGTPMTKDSGLIVIAPDDRAKSRIDDVILDGVTVYNTSQWAGIIINGAGFDSSDGQDHGDRIEVRNSIVHDVAGDGILLARVSHGVIEHNLAWSTGMQETQSIGTPNAIWEWRCRDCRVAYNEGFFTDSPGVDGGVFDIDYGDENNLLEYNFGHDSQGYCVSVFGAEGPGGNSTHSEIRHNTCIHNGRSPRLSKRQGAIFLYTWNGGKLDGVDIADNTVVWDPPSRVAAFQSTAEFTGNLPNRFTNNTVLAVAGPFVSTEITGQPVAGKSSSLQFSDNHYGALETPPSSASTSDSDPSATKPQALCAIIQNLLQTTAGNTPTPSATVALTKPSGHWLLSATLKRAPVQTANPLTDADHGMLILIESMMHQFGVLGLTSIIVPAHAMSDEELKRWIADWHIDPAVKIDTDHALGLRDSGNSADTLQLISPAGKVSASWQYPIPPADVWLQIQSHLGTPPGAQQMPACLADTGR